MRFLVDTNICIYIINKHPPHVMRRFGQLEPGEVVVSVITVSELWYGAAKSRNADTNRHRLEEFLAPLEVLAFDAEAALAYGAMRQGLEEKGRFIGPLDMLIAAHALSLDLTLVTNNVDEFRRVEGLRVENWAA